MTAAGTPEFELRDPDSEFVIAFVPVEITGEPVCHEHQALAWGRPEELARLRLAPTDRRYVEHLLGTSRSVHA